MSELKQTIEDLNKGFAALQSELKGAKERGEAVNTEVDQKLTKMSDDITKKLEDVQKAQLAEKARADALETMLNRLPGNSGKQVAEIEEKSKVALDHYMRTGECEGFKVSKAEGLEIRAMSTDVNPDGGYLVRPELANFMVQRAFETSPLRSLARVITIGSKSIEVDIDDNEADARWAGEGASGGETSTPQVGKLTIAAHKLEAEPKATVEMLEDGYVDVEAWLREKVTDKFGRKENTSFFVGTGVDQPRGLLTFAKWATAGVYERNKIEQIALGNASALTADGLIDLQGSLKEVYQARAHWLMKRTSFSQALKLKGDDNYFFSPTLLKDGLSSLQLLGKNVTFCDDMPAVAADALAVAYGDFGQGYTIVDRVGVQVLRDPMTAKGFVKFYTTKRVGGEVTNYDSFKIGKVATSV